MSHKSYPTYSVLEIFLWCCKNKSYRIAYKKWTSFTSDKLILWRSLRLLYFDLISLHSLKCLLTVEPIILWSCLIRIKYMRNQYHIGEAVFKNLKYTVPFVFETIDPRWAARTASDCLWQVLITFGCSNQIRLLFLPAKIEPGELHVLP